MYLCIYSEDTYPYEVIRHHDHCSIPHSDMAMDIEKGVSNIPEYWKCDMGEGGGGIIEIEIQDCECCEIDYLAIDTRNPDEIPF